MAQKRENRFTLRVFPWRAGLGTAGQQTTMPENMLWQAKNTSAELDGLLGKRPGTKQWGQTLQSPDSDATGSTVTSFSDFLEGLGGYVETDASDQDGIKLITLDTNSPGVLKASVLAGTAPLSNESYTASHSIAGLSLGEVWSVRFIFSGTNLPAYNASDTDPNTFVIRGQAASGTGKEFAIWSGGLYYKLASDDTYQLIPGSEDAGTGKWTVIEIQVDDSVSGTTTVLIDDVDVTSTPITSSAIKGVALTGTTDFEFRWEVEGSGSSGTQYNTQVTTPMYNDTVTAPFTAVTVGALTDFQYITRSGSARSALICAAGDHIYADNGLKGVWRPLKSWQYSEAFFLDYRRTIVWMDHDGGQRSNTWQWDGSADPEALDDAPNVRFGAEHQQKILAAGDREHPLRAYLTGDRQPNLWFSPSETNVEDQFDAALEAGYIEIPSGRGDEITAIYGDYYGSSVIWTKRGAWRLVGHGATSYQIQRIAGVDVGAENAFSVAQIGNDLWYLGRQGIQSLQTTDQFGDLKTQFPSGPIQNLWGQSPSSVVRIAAQYLNRSRMSYNPQLGLLYVAVPLTGEVQAENVYIYNVNTQVWLGPWTIDSRTLVNVELRSPRLEVMMHAGSDGRCRYTDESVRSDAGDTSAIEMILQSAYLNGRSIPEAGAQLVGLDKVWKTLRLYLLPRGNWDFTVEWETDAVKTGGPVTKNQNREKVHVLTEDWKINEKPDGILRSREEMVYVEIPLDITGSNLTFTITQDKINQDLVVQGYEVEFVAGGYEVD